MKVLIAHNRYRSATPSGENAIVESEIALLRAAGIDIVTMLEDSDSISRRETLTLAAAATGPIYSKRGVRRFGEIVRTHQPDVVHVHNVFPLISPAVVHSATKLGLPVVQTTHNYRHTCVKGIHYRDEHVCTDCLGHRFPSPAVQHGCYRGSRAQTIPMAISQALHQNTWRQVSRYLALTPFMADFLIKAGIPADRITIRPSWTSDPGPRTAPGTDVLFVGRLDEAKGIHLLFEAWALRSGLARPRTLRIAGGGPLEGAVRAASARDSSVVYLGSLDKAGVARALQACAFLVLPSLTFEGYPLVVAEAFSHGRPVLVAEGGSVASIIDDSVGWTSPPTPKHLAASLSTISDDEADIRGIKARQRYKSDNTPLAARDSLLRVYTEVSAETSRP